MNNVKIRITENGLENLNLKITQMEQLVKKIQAEKAIAYTASGDGWHDNPGFNQLEQKEFRAINDLYKLKNQRDSAIIIRIEKRNIDVVQIGSIVKIEQFYTKDNATRIIVWEIVGHQESDLKLNRIAYDTPVGSALLGKKVDDVIEVTLPVGKARFRILSLFEDWSTVYDR
jgi:transcription elongation GreA/GreB family factor